MAVYTEREHTEPVLLCDDRGDLNDGARGWSRHPVHICNLSGHPNQKKKWNFWLILNERFGLSVTLANIDYIGAGNIMLFDMRTHEMLSDNTVVTPQGRGLDMPETVDSTVKLNRADMKVGLVHEPGVVRIRALVPKAQGGRLDVDITLHKPAEHETLNTVIPWSREQFHFTSKQNTLAATGTVTLGDRSISFAPEDSFGVLDFGRGIWPREFIWNWASFNTRQGADLIGINLGGKWTDGTGANENGLCLNGRLHKIMEDVIFEYDTADFMKPWRLYTSDTNAVDLVLTPVWDKAAGVNMGDTKTGTHQCFGHFSGTVRAGDRTVEIRNAFGWAEEHIGNW
jgi:hypothetical protein